MGGFIMDLRTNETQQLIALGCAIILAIITCSVGGQVHFFICAYSYYACTFQFIVPKVIAIVVEHKTTERCDVFETLSSVSCMMMIFVLSTMWIYQDIYTLVLLFILLTLILLSRLYLIYHARKKAKNENNKND